MPVVAVVVAVQVPDPAVVEALEVEALVARVLLEQPVLQTQVVAAAVELHHLVMVAQAVQAS
jgi:hypothetical protein